MLPAPMMAMFTTVLCVRGPAGLRCVGYELCVGGLGREPLCSAHLRRFVGSSGLGRQ